MSTDPAAAAAGPAAPSGAPLLAFVATVDRLRSPGGCPWYAEQTHASLAPYAVEEAHELAEAIADGGREHLVEELGDVLLQVVLHARLGEEDQGSRFDLDDVAARVDAKLRARNPHVFGDERAADVGAVEARWEQLKAAEKPGRTSVLDGIAPSLPALQRAQKVQTRLARRDAQPAVPGDADPDVLALWAAVDRLRRRGVDAEQALGALVRQVGRADEGRPAARDDADQPRAGRPADGEDR